MNKKSILLIAFKYPPYARVGSYRWTKYSRLFAENGWKVHVITVNWDANDKDNWNNEVKHPNITIHRIRSNSFQNIKYRIYGNNPAGKIFNKIRNQFEKIMRVFYFVDEAQFWGSSLIPYASNLIKKENIGCMVATGAPFMENYWASVLWNKLDRKVPLIQDFRDEWNCGRYFPYKWQRKRSLKYEKYAVNNCNAVVTASPGLRDLFKPLIDAPHVKTEVIFNGFDPATVKNIYETENKSSKKRFSFIYGGSLENGRDKMVTVFLDCVSENIESFPEIELIFYTNSKLKNLNSYKKLIDNGNLKIRKVVPQRELYKEIYNSFCAIHFMPPGQEFIVSIKLFEYGIFKRPVLSINAGGDTVELIQKHKLGYSVHYNEKEVLKKSLLELYSCWTAKPDYEIATEGLDEYSYTIQTKKYLDLIESLRS